jgi:hypothetical protein
MMSYKLYPSFSICNSVKQFHPISPAAAGANPGDGCRIPYSSMKFGGLLGEITYRGDLTPFLPWLALGEWMHISGKTSFGLGRYTIEPPRRG